MTKKRYHSRFFSSMLLFFGIFILCVGMLTPQKASAYLLGQDVTIQVLQAPSEIATRTVIDNPGSPEFTAGNTLWTNGLFTQDTIDIGDDFVKFSFLGVGYFPDPFDYKITGLTQGIGVNTSLTGISILSSQDINGQAHINSSDLDLTSLASGLLIIDFGPNTVTSPNPINVTLTLQTTTNHPPVPEPTTIALLGIGMVGFAGAEVRRRRKKKSVDNS